MCVWQSQACGGISKFTGVAGWEAFAKLGRLRARTPVAMTPVRKLRRVSMVAPSSRARSNQAHAMKDHRAVTDCECALQCTSYAKCKQGFASLQDELSPAYANGT